MRMFGLSAAALVVACGLAAPGVARADVMGLSLTTFTALHVVPDVSSVSFSGQNWLSGGYAPWTFATSESGFQVPVYAPGVFYSVNPAPIASVDVLSEIRIYTPTEIYAEAIEGGQVRRWFEVDGQVIDGVGRTFDSVNLLVWEAIGPADISGEASISWRLTETSRFRMLNFVPIEESWFLDQDSQIRTTVPTPGAAGLVLAGIAVIAGRRRK